MQARAKVTVFIEKYRDGFSKPTPQEVTEFWYDLDQACDELFKDMIHELYPSDSDSLSTSTPLDELSNFYGMVLAFLGSDKVKHGSQADFPIAPLGTGFEFVKVSGGFKFAKEKPGFFDLLAITKEMIRQFERKYGMKMESITLASLKKWQRGDGASSNTANDDLVQQQPVSKEIMLDEAREELRQRLKWRRRELDSETNFDPRLTHSKRTKKEAIDFLLLDLIPVESLDDDLSEDNQNAINYPPEHISALTEGRTRKVIEDWANDFNYSRYAQQILPAQLFNPGQEATIRIWERITPHNDPDLDSRLTKLYQYVRTAKSSRKVSKEALELAIRNTGKLVLSPNDQYRYLTIYKDVLSNEASAFAEPLREYVDSLASDKVSTHALPIDALTEKFARSLLSYVAKHEKEWTFSDEYHSRLDDAADLAQKLLCCHTQEALFQIKIEAAQLATKVNALRSKSSLLPILYNLEKQIDDRNLFRQTPEQLVYAHKLDLLADQIIYIGDYLANEKGSIWYKINYIHRTMVDRVSVSADLLIKALKQAPPNVERIYNEARALLATISKTDPSSPLREIAEKISSYADYCKQIAKTIPDADPATRIDIKDGLEKIREGMREFRNLNDVDNILTRTIDGKTIAMHLGTIQAIFDKPQISFYDAHEIKQALSFIADIINQIWQQFKEMSSIDVKPLIAKINEIKHSLYQTLMQNFDLADNTTQLFLTIENYKMETMDWDSSNLYCDEFFTHIDNIYSSKDLSNPDQKYMEMCAEISLAVKKKKAVPSSCFFSCRGNEQTGFHMFLCDLKENPIWKRNGKDRDNKRTATLII